MRRNLFWLSDEQWKRIERHLPTDVRGVERADDRRVISGIVHVLKSGCHWCDCPPQSGLRELTCEWQAAGHFPRGAAQTRIVSVAGIRLHSRKSVRPFKEIICGDISEIAVGTLITERPPQSGRIEARIGLR